MGSGWKDITSYTHGERSKGVTPRTWEAAHGRLRVIVTRQLRLPGWYLRCDEIRLGTSMPVDLGDIDIEDAKREALRIVRQRVNALACDIRDLCTDLEGRGEAAEAKRELARLRNGGKHGEGS